MRLRSPIAVRAILGIAAVASMLVAVAPASAQTTSEDFPNSWNCRASAVRAQLFNSAFTEPIVANGARPDSPSGATRPFCESDDAGPADLEETVTLGIGLDAAFARTVADPEGEVPARQTVSAASTIAEVRLPDPAGDVLRVEAVRSSAQARCENGLPVFSGQSDTARVFLGGAEIPTNALVNGISQQVVNPLLGEILVTIEPGEEVTTGTPGTGIATFVKRGLHVNLHLGDGQILDLVLAESSVSTNGNPCINTTGPPGGGQGQDGDQNCPTPLIAGIFCGGGFTVTLPLDRSQLPQGYNLTDSDIRQINASRCAKPGRFGPLVGIIGTSGKDRITGTNARDRIFGASGNDSISGGRGIDCVDGGRDNDRLDGDIGSDFVYGYSGNDTSRGGLDNDRLSGGSGNDKLDGNAGSDRIYGLAGRDILQSGYGRGFVSGGSGNDALNIAVATPYRQRASCGSGRDTVRKQRYDQVTGCERVRNLRNSRG